MLWNSLKILTRAIRKEYGLFNIPAPACFLATIKLLQVNYPNVFRMGNGIFSS